MWKYIIIGALVILLFGSFVYFKNQDAMVMVGGEAETVQTQFQNSVKRLVDINTDKTILTYADMRTKHFEGVSGELRSEKEALDAENTNVQSQIEQTDAEIKSAEAKLDSLREDMELYTTEVAKLVGRQVDPDNLDAVARELATLVIEQGGPRAELEKENRTIAALEQETKRLETVIAEQKKLAQDRQARISPEALECRVSSVDPSWGYVLLDAGVNKGIVIGSRLAVMRGEVKICELNVTNVESRKSSADVVRSTLMTAEQVRPGDRVIAVRNTDK